MKIKVGDRIYDGKDEPVMVILTDQDKKNIAKATMRADFTKYCEAPDDMPVKEIEAWMNKDC